MRVVALWAAFGLWLAILWALSSGPPVVTSDSGAFPIRIDKVLHFGYFFGGTVCLMLALLNTISLRGWRLAFLAFAIMAFIGATDEFHQSFTPNRQGSDPGDWLADCVGALAGVMVTSAIYGKVKSERSSEPRPRTQS